MLLVASADLTTAIFGLGGVLLGALIAATAQVWTTFRAERQQRREDVASFQAGARLLLSELDQIDAFLDRLETQNEWESPPESARWTTAWETERRSTATGVRDVASFRAIANGFLVAVMIESTARQRNGKPLGEDELSYVKGFLHPAVATARTTLERQLGPHAS